MSCIEQITTKQANVNNIQSLQLSPEEKDSPHDARHTTAIRTATMIPLSDKGA